MTRNIYLKFCIELISKVKFPKNSHLETAHFLSARVHSQTQTVTEYRGTPLLPFREQWYSQTPNGARLGSHFSRSLSLAHLPPRHLPASWPPLWVSWESYVEGHSIRAVAEVTLQQGCERIAGIISTNLMPVDVGFQQRLLTKWARCLKKEGERACAVFNAHSKLFILNMNMW